MRIEKIVEGRRNGSLKPKINILKIYKKIQLSSCCDPLIHPLPSNTFDPLLSKDLHLLRAQRSGRLVKLTILFSVVFLFVVCLLLFFVVLFVFVFFWFESTFLTLFTVEFRLIVYSLV